MSTHCNPKNLVRLVLRSIRSSWMLISTDDTNRMFNTVLATILIVLIVKTASEAFAIIVAILLALQKCIFLGFFSFHDFIFSDQFR